MPDSQTETGTISPQPVSAPRPDITDLMGWPQDKVNEALGKLKAEQGNKLELEEKGRTIYVDVVMGEGITRIDLDSGTMELPRTTSPDDFLDIIENLPKEGEQAPPKDEINEILLGFTKQALTSSPDFQIAARAANLIAEGNLIVRKDLIDILNEAADTDQKKLALAKALEKVIPKKEEAESTASASQVEPAQTTNDTSGPTLKLPEEPLALAPDALPQVAAVNATADTNTAESTAASIPASTETTAATSDGTSSPDRTDTAAASSAAGEPTAHFADIPTQPEIAQDASASTTPVNAAANMPPLLPEAASAADAIPESTAGQADSTNLASAFDGSQPDNANPTPVLGASLNEAPVPADARPAALGIDGHLQIPVLSAESGSPDAPAVVEATAANTGANALSDKISRFPTPDTSSPGVLREAPPPNTTPNPDIPPINDTTSKGRFNIGPLHIGRVQPAPQPQGLEDKIAA